MFVIEIYVGGRLLWRGLVIGERVSFGFVVVGGLGSVLGV